MEKIKKTVHKPVLLQEVIDSLNLKKGDIVFDGTLGGGGYSFEICKKITESGILIGTDLDSTAIAKTEAKLRKFKNKKYFIQSNFSEIKNILEKNNINKVNKIVLDLGISSDQLEKEKRGISFKDRDELLDMNLSDKDKKITASEILNQYSEDTLADLFFYYGGEKAAKKISKAIVEKRKEKKFIKVSDLTVLIEEQVGHFYKNKKINPSTKVFQALRITVNNEIENLKKVLKEGFEVLEKGGVFSVVTFHSLEDKNVKKIFHQFQKEGLGKKVNKKVIKPSLEEVNNNKRSRSAKLRVFQKK